jgi:aspartyl-tRNA(Asn)/glutamyl-tRNA(Gln) amidotransferase subunit C
MESASEVWKISLPSFRPWAIYWPGVVAAAGFAGMLEFPRRSNAGRQEIALKISREDVLRVAELAYLDLSETELEMYRAQIDEILEYIGKLNELDTAKVEPMAQVLSDEQTADATLREDLVVPCAVAEDVLKHAPDPEPPYFRVPKVIER